MDSPNVSNGVFFKKQVPIKPQIPEVYSKYEIVFFSDVPSLIFHFVS